MRDFFQHKHQNVNGELWNIFHLNFEKKKWYRPYACSLFFELIYEYSGIHVERMNQDKRICVDFCNCSPSGIPNENTFLGTLSDSN